MRIIINADDLGRSAEANGAIFDLMERGLVTSATVIANGPAVEECVVRIPSYPFCSFGIHLNITEFQPLSSHPALYDMLDEKGGFSLRSYKTTHFHSALREAVFAEWSEQIRKLMSFGLRISHIDSHHDVHTNPRLFWALKRIQARFNIRRVRICSNISLDPRVPFFRNRMWNVALRRIYSTKTTAGFTEFATFLSAAKRRRLTYPSMELMVHPGHPRFTEETRALETQWAEHLPFPVSLIPYHDL